MTILPPEQKDRPTSCARYMTGDMVLNLSTTQILSAAGDGRGRGAGAPRGRLKALCDVMEPLIRHGDELKSSEIDIPRERERDREGEGGIEAACFILIKSFSGTATIT